MERPAAAASGLSSDKEPSVTQRDSPLSTISVRPHISRPVTRTFLPESSSPSCLALSPGWFQMLRSSVVHCWVFAALIAAPIAVLDMNAGGGRSRDVVALTRSSERVIGSSPRSADTPDALATLEIDARGVRAEAAGPAGSTPLVPDAGVGRAASGPMTATGLGFGRRASGSRLWRWSATALIPLLVGYTVMRRPEWWLRADAVQDSTTRSSGQPIPKVWVGVSPVTSSAAAERGSRCRARRPR